MKPLFVPLKTKYFRQFESGKKRTEYRLYGPRWNERTCLPGRPVTLSHGYSGKRIKARVVKFSIIHAKHIPAAAALYGAQSKIAAIHLDLG